MVRDIVDKDGAVIGQLDLPDNTPESVWEEKLNEYKAVAAQMPLRDYLKYVYIPKVRAFANELETDFIVENIAMGISQLNKTSRVLGIIHQKVDLEGEPQPISLMNTLQAACPSLTVTIKILDYHLANMNSYSDAAPFVTTERFTEMNDKIKKFLGII